jgi:alanine racemase
MRGTRAYIHLDSLQRNIQRVRRKIGGTPKILLPVKADAYGHGAAAVARAALEGGASFLAVAAVEEGAALRQAGITAPVLLFSLPIPEEFPDVAALGLIPLVPDREFAAALDRTAAGTGKKLPVHLKIDTGMGRLGCPPEEAAELAAYIASRPFLEYVGTATHLACADSAAPEDLRRTGEQLARFRKALEDIRAAGLDPGMVHAANSGAVVFHGDAAFDMVRPGILIYGYSPAPEIIPAEPVMELRSRVVFIKTVKKGAALSYGGAWTAAEDTVIGVLPVGYADGLPRGLSGRYPVMIRDRSYPLVGRICMDQCLVNLGPGSAVQRWEEVIVFGGKAPGADALAARLNTIPYEITCGISKRVPRVYGP